MKRTKTKKRIIAMFMALVMSLAVATSAMAGPITRNAVALGSAGLHATAHVVSATEAVKSTALLPASVPLGATALNPFVPLGLGARTVLLLSGDAVQFLPLTKWMGAQAVKAATIPPVAHAVIWNGIDVALIGTGATLATGAVVAGAGAAALGTTALVGTGLALGTGALATTAVVGTGLALGAGALGTTALVGTGLALGAGALATTAVVGTGAALGTAYVAHKVLSPTHTLISAPLATEAAEVGTTAATTVESLPVLGTAIKAVKDVGTQLGLAEASNVANTAVAETVTA